MLDDFSIRFDRGGIYGLLGPNGVGKSTLLYLICGALIPRSGHVTFDGTDTRLRRPATLSDIFLVPEEISLPHISLERFIAINSPFYPGFDRNIMDRCLEVFDMRCDGRLDSMSMGQKKKAFMSFALACNTRVLLMDEPTNGLDIPGKAAFRRLVAEHVTDDRIFIISTHQVRDLEQLLDHVVIMNAQKVLFDRDIAQIQQRLKFLRNVSYCPDSALHSLRSIGGFDIIIPNTDEDDTDVNLEILFDFALKSPDKLTALFNPTSALQ